MTTTKQQFIDKLAQKTGIDAKSVSKVFLDFLDLLVEEVHNGNRIEFRGTFILDTKYQNSRLANNPKTLEKVEIPARRVVYFKRGDRLKVMRPLPKAEKE